MHVINRSSLTPVFQDLLREDNPLWTDEDCQRWSWGLSGKWNDDVGSPRFDGEQLPFLNEVDSSWPGGTSIARMYHAIKTGVWELVKVKPHTFTLRTLR